MCGGAVALKIPRKLIWDSWFCNIVSCKTQISIERAVARGDLLENVAKASLLKLLTKENLLVCSN